MFWKFEKNEHLFLYVTYVNYFAVSSYLAVVCLEKFMKGD